MSQLSVPWPHAVYVHELPTKATLAPSSSRLSCVYSFSSSYRILFEKLVVAYLVNIFPLSYCMVHSGNISTLASSLTRLCARWIRLSCHILFKICFNIILMFVVTYSQILLLQFCIISTLSAARTAQSKSQREKVFFLCKTFSPALGPTHSPTQWKPG